jgi:CDGSH-type Zn-finger protein/mannose-6-phosphate isomerase-like protein (cupin superfamily)
MSDVVDRVVARRKPYYQELKAGRTYFWCACGRSRNQPFCDGSHKGTPFTPIAYTAKQDGEEVLFCGCKHSRTPPFCDGAHNNLSETYDLDDADSAANRAIPSVTAGADGKAVLDGGCFVCSVEPATLARRGALGWRRIIGRGDGALHQSMFHLECGRGTSPVLGFGDRHVILFVAAGAGAIDIGGRRFALEPNMGVHVRPGEAFGLINDADAALIVLAAACPLADDITWHEAMPERFDAALPTRTIGIDPDGRNRMGDRFFQMLVDKAMGSTVVTQFIGEIPLSKAAPHRHLYEESLIVMRGSGQMWTETKKAKVGAGDVIFLPRKQLHSLQCTDPGGMLVAGVIYPGDNPSINY